MGSRLFVLRVFLSVTILLLSVLLALAPASQAIDLATRSRTASRAMEQGQFDEAARIYRELLQALPTDPGLLMNLGMALAMGGHEADALDPLQRAVKLNPRLAPAHLFLGSSYLALGEPAKAIAPLQRAVAARPAEIEPRRMLAQAYAESGRALDAVTQLQRLTELAPKLPAGWFALGNAYNALTQAALASFERDPESSPWRRLLVADALYADGRYADAFAIYREVEPLLPAMTSIHESIARIYEHTKHPDWASVERAKGAVPPAACVKQKALCEFRAGRHRAALAAAGRLTDPESRYWQARAATELALAAFKRLDALADSRERREVRATMARAERRYADAVAELKAALTFAPGDLDLLDDLGTAFYLARDYEQAVKTLAPVIAGQTDDPRLLTVYGDSLVQLQRVDEALPLLRRAVDRDPAYGMARQMLGRAYVLKGDFAAAIPMIESQLAADQDGSLHIQLANAYKATGQRQKAEALLGRAQDLQRASQARDAGPTRPITPPK